MPVAQDFLNRLERLRASHHALLERPNHPAKHHNGIYKRWDHGILTPAHTPLIWRYDLNPATNPFLMERLGVNATFNSGAIYRDGKYLLVVRVEGADRKSFFAVAES